MTAKKTKKPAKKQQRSAACTQADKNRDSADDDNFNPKHSPRFQLRKLWSVPTDEVEKRIQNAKTNKKTPYGEYLALAQASRAVRSTKDFVETMNQAEGAPVQSIDMEIYEEKKSPYDDLTVEELRKLLGEEE